MTGSQRVMLYRLAIESGLRAYELRSLMRASFDLSSPEPTVTVHSAFTKSRWPTMLPLRADTAKGLQAMLTTKLPEAPAFNMPKRDQVVHMLRANLQAAGIPYRIDPKHSKAAEFHSLRHTRGS